MGKNVEFYFALFISPSERKFLFRLAEISAAAEFFSALEGNLAAVWFYVNIRVSAHFPLVIANTTYFIKNLQIWVYQKHSKKYSWFCSKTPYLKSTVLLFIDLRFCSQLWNVTNVHAQFLYSTVHYGATLIFA